MKITHKLDRALKAPQTDKVYGARVTGVTVSPNGQVLTFGWTIFARKLRTKRRKAIVKAGVPK